MSKNDERVLQLKKIIEVKRSELKTVKKFTPITNCILDLEGQKYNLNVLHPDDLRLLLVKVNMYLMSVKDLGIKLEISGYNIEDWITDINNKMEIFEHKYKESELKTTHQQVTSTPFECFSTIFHHCLHYVWSYHRFA